MTGWMVDTARLAECAQDLQQTAERFRNISEDIQGISKHIALEDRAVVLIRKRLGNISSNLETYSAAGTHFSGAVQQAIEQYRQADQQVYEQFGGVVTVRDNTAPKAQGNNESDHDHSSFDWGKIATAFGPGGNVLAILMELINSSDNAGKKFGKIGQYLSKIIGTISDAGSDFDWKHFWKMDRKDLWKNLWGMNEKELSGYSIEEQLSSYNIAEAAGKGKAISAAAKWAGVLFTAITTAADNFSDDSMTWQRKLAETVGETAVKVTESMALKAGIGFVLGVMGVTSAPFWVLPLLTATAAIGIDAATKCITKWRGNVNADGSGKDFAEFVSDTVLDHKKKKWDNWKQKIKNLYGNVTRASKLQAAW